MKKAKEAKSTDYSEFNLSTGSNSIFITEEVTIALGASVVVGSTHRACVSNPDLLLQLFARGSHDAGATGGATVAFLLGASESGRELSKRRAGIHILSRSYEDTRRKQDVKKRNV